jgi:hypothetical protein
MALTMSGAVQEPAILIQLADAQEAEKHGGMGVG